MKTFFVVIIILLLSTAILGVFYSKKCNKNEVIKGVKATLRRYLFLFRWFLIGKNHCNLHDKYKKIIFILHKIFWGIVLISLSVSFGKVVEWII